MATKRPAPTVHPSRQDQVPQEPQSKRRKTNPTPHSQPKAHPINPLKSRIRSVQRLLNHNDDLPADVRLAHERELQSLQWDLEQAVRAQQRTEMIGKYHKIRFFDRQKATKRLKRAKKALAALEGLEDREGLAKRVRDAEVELNYALYYPLDQAYVSLFPSRRKGGGQGGEGEGDAEEGAEGSADVVAQGDKKMWALVEKCMADGTLDALRNGKIGLEERGTMTSAPAVKKQLVKSKAKAGRNAPAADVHGTRRERRAAKAAEKEEEDDSEGGFFE